MSDKKQLRDIVNGMIAEALSSVHTITIARVESVGEKLIDVQPVISRMVRGKDVELPLFVDVPPVFLQGGESYTAHPIAVGDYCLLMVCERCFDEWYRGRDGARPLSARMHNYSDGFALVGVNPQAMLIDIPTETTHTGVQRFGVADPQDFMALAGKVLSELQVVKDEIESVRTAFNGHVHAGVTSGAASTAPVASAIPATTAPQSVASTWVKSE